MVVFTRAKWCPDPNHVGPRMLPEEGFPSTGLLRKGDGLPNRRGLCFECHNRKKTARHHERMEDPEYRETRRVQSIDRYYRIAGDSDAWQAKLETERRYKAKLRESEEGREELARRRRESEQRRREERPEEWEAARKKRNAAHLRRMAEDPGYREKRRADRRMQYRLKRMREGHEVRPAKRSLSYRETCSAAPLLAWLETVIGAEEAALMLTYEDVALGAARERRDAGRPADVLAHVRDAEAAMLKAVAGAAAADGITSPQASMCSTLGIPTRALSRWRTDGRITLVLLDQIVTLYGDPALWDRLYYPETLGLRGTGARPS